MDVLTLIGNHGPPGPATDRSESARDFQNFEHREIPITKIWFEDIKFNQFDLYQGFTGRQVRQPNGPNRSEIF